MDGVRDIEQRGARSSIEWRAGKGGLGVLTGYASVFGSRSENLGGFVEFVDPAAFNKTLADKVPVVARFNHNDNFLLGTTEASTLRLSVDKRTGLRYDVDLPDTSAGRDVKALAERGDLRYSSFAFQTITDKWEQQVNGELVRTLLSVKLVDVAPVVNPAYRATSSGMRSLAVHLGRDVQEVEEAAAAGRLAALLGHPGATADRAGMERVQALRRRLDAGLVGAEPSRRLLGQVTRP